MPRIYAAFLATVAAALLVLSGCRHVDWKMWNPGFKFACFGKEDCDPCAETGVDFYRHHATQIEYTDVDACCDDVCVPPPATILGEGAVEYWDLSLEEALHHALQNAQIMRDLGGLVLRSPENIGSIYDPAINEMDPRFGPEAALSAFDASFASSAFFEHNDRALNNQFFGGGTRILQQDTAVFQSQLSKRAATGTEFFARKIMDYDANNAPGNTFSSAWNVQLESEVRHPLLQGGGIDFNRIAGPGDVPGVINGVLVARVNTDIELAAFEEAVRNLVSDVENAYVDLYFAYRDLDAKIRARDAALETWRSIRALQLAGRRGGEAAKESQAREQYFRFQEEVQLALTGRLLEGTRTNNGSSGGTFRATGGVHVAERRLRLLLSLPINDGRIIRPVDEPIIARVDFNWDESLYESLSRRVELRRQKWAVKQRELEVIAAKNFLLPQLDVVGLYRWRGFGRDLFQQHDAAANSVGIEEQLANVNDPNEIFRRLRDDSFGNRLFNAAADNLAAGDFQEWQLGVEFFVPIGFRRAHAAYRYAELRLARERAILCEQERSVVHDLANAIADAERAYALVETNFNRRIAAIEQVEFVQRAYDLGDAPIDQLLDAQRRRAEAEIAYYRSLAEYQLAVKNVHFEKGSLLEYNSVFLEEGPWPDEAYADAQQRFKLRHEPWFLDHSLVRPRIISSGPTSLRMHPGLPIEDEHRLPVEGELLEVPPSPLEGAVPMPAENGEPLNEAASEWGDDVTGIRPIPDFAGPAEIQPAQATPMPAGDFAPPATTDTSDQRTTDESEMEFLIPLHIQPEDASGEGVEAAAGGFSEPPGAVQ